MVTLCSMWDLSSPTRDQTRALYIGNMASQPLDCPGNPINTIFLKNVLRYSQLANNVVIVLGEQRRNSATHTHIHTHTHITHTHIYNTHTHTSIHSLQTSLPSRLPCNIDQSSIYYTVGPVLHTAMCTCQSQTLNLFLLPTFLPW